MDWKTATHNDEGLLKIPKRWLHTHYYEALNILFRFENSLRVFVYVVLKNEYLDKWEVCNFSVNQGDAKSIKGIASTRIKQAENHGYLGYDINAPLMHLTSGELVEIMTCDAYWKLFKKHFKGNKDIIKNKLLEIGTIRNSLAHFRPIKPEDIELIKQNSRHSLLGVEICLSNLFTQHSRVPTNTEDEWYKLISTIGSKEITTTLHHSEDEEWIKIQLTFTTPTLEKISYSDDFLGYKLGKITTPNMLMESENLKKYVTYQSEYVGYPALDNDRDIHIVKNVNFVFNKAVLIKNHEEIGSALKEIVHTISEECELIKSDNLARGTIVKSTDATVFISTDQSPKFHYNGLKEAYKSEHPNEYWGEATFGSNDIIAGSRRYPWMPDDISSSEGFI